MYAFVIFLVAVIQSICLHQYFIRVMVVGMRLRTAVMYIVYKKVGMERAGWTHPLIMPPWQYLLFTSYKLTYVLVMFKCPQL